MKIEAQASPEIHDASAKEKTGKTLAQWFAVLDQAGGLAKGRRELSNLVLEQVGKDAWWATTIVVEYERAKGQKEKDGRPTGYSICSTKSVAAPLGRVFASFGSQADLDRWLGAGTRVSFAEGGALTNDDGDRLRFTRIRADKDLRLAWEHATRAPGSQVEVLFADKGQGKTGITLNHTRIATRREADELRSGWGAALEALKRHLEGA